jgi:hypothetical protein
MAEKKPYEKPVLTKHEQLREVTLARVTPSGKCSK